MLWPKEAPVKRKKAAAPRAMEKSAPKSTEKILRRWCADLDFLGRKASVLEGASGEEGKCGGYSASYSRGERGCGRGGLRRLSIPSGTISNELNGVLV